MSLVRSVNLLLANHVLDVLSPHFLIVFVLCMHFSIHLLLLLRIKSFLPCFCAGHVLVVLHCFRVLLLHVVVHLRSLSNFGKLLLLTFQLVSCELHVAATLANDVVGTFPCLIDFSHGLNLKPFCDISEKLPCFLLT